MSQPPNDGHNGSDNPSQGLGLPDIDMGGLGISVDQFLMSPMAGTSAEAGVPQQHPQLPPQPLQQVSGRRGAFREELGEDGDTTMSNTREVVSETSDSPRGRYPPDRGESDTSPLIVAPYRAPENPLPNSSDMYYDIQPGAQNVPPTKGLIPMFKPSDAVSIQLCDDPSSMSILLDDKLLTSLGRDTHTSSSRIAFVRRPKLFEELPGLEFRSRTQLKSWWMG
jgi:hypothetical protein